LIRRDPDYRFLDHFGTIYVSGELGMIKPDADIFHHVLGDVGLPAERILFIDDSAKNIEAADGLGFATHRFASSAGLEAELRRRNLLV
jgi:HAD superfamily hydrolase (TIGR01509 family)